jgi:hypothetical protein
MAYNPTVKYTFYYVDGYGMFVVLGDENSWRDSVGRNFYAYIAYRDTRLLEAMWECSKIVDGEIELRRHPFIDSDDMSRDHLTYILLAIKMFKPQAVKQFTELLTRRVSDEANITLDMWWWIKSISGRKRYQVLYYLLSIPMALGGLIWNSLLSGAAAFVDGEQKSELYSWMYPFYAMQIMSWQLYVMPNTWAKKVLQRICRWHTDKTNYAVRLVLGDKSVKLSDIQDWKSTKQWRWGVKLKTTNRDMSLIDPDLLVYNDLEKDYVIGLFYMIHLDLS